jgi:hypothetical protein
LHDLEKPWKYAGTPEEQSKLKSASHEEIKEFMIEKVKAYGIELTPEHMNALKYVHGE